MTENYREGGSRFIRLSIRLLLNRFFHHTPFLMPGRRKGHHDGSNRALKGIAASVSRARKERERDRGREGEKGSHLV